MGKKIIQNMESNIYIIKKWSGKLQYGECLDVVESLYDAVKLIEKFGVGEVKWLNADRKCDSRDDMIDALEASTKKQFIFKGEQMYSVKIMGY